MKKAFNTSINETILDAFRKKCKEDGFSANLLLEKFMDGYVKGYFEMKMKYKSTENEE